MHYCFFELFFCLDILNSNTLKNNKWYDFKNLGVSADFRITHFLILHIPLLFQGATIKADEVTGRILIARVMHGGAADRSGLISVGDEVKEIKIDA